MSTEETSCPKAEDSQHCVHWYDGDSCCRCSDPGMTNDEKRKQGMIDDDDDDE